MQEDVVMKKTADIVKEEVSFSGKLSYGIGGMAGEIVYSSISFYLMYFLTDVALISPAVGGLIMAIPRAWDAFADFFMGYLSDFVRSKRMLILIGAIPLGISFSLLFQVPDFSVIGKEIYFTVIALLAWTLQSFTTMPYFSMVPNMTMDTHERTKIMAYSKIFGMVTLLLLGGAFLPLVNLFSDGANQASGFSKLAIIIGIIVAVIWIITGLASREKHTVSAEHRYKFKEGFGLIKQNKPYLILIAVVCIEFTIFTMVVMVMNYFFKYCVPFESFIPIAFICLFAVAAVSMPLWVIISKKIGKKLVYQIGFIGFGLTLLANFFNSEPNMLFLLPLFILAGFFFCGLSLSFLSNTPDTVDYGQWKTGSRCEGFQYGLYNFTIKAAGSISGLIVGFALEYSGYVPNVQQSEGSLMAIRLLLTVVPFLLCVLGAIVMQWYKLDETMHKQIRSDLETKHAIS